MQTFIKIKKISGMLLLLLLLNSKYCAAQFGANVNFDGSTQSIITPSGTMNGATVFTIEFWIQTTENRSNGTYWQRPSMISSASNGNASGDFGITTDNGYIGMWSGLNGGGDNFFLSGTTQINNNAWHHVAAVNNGTIITLYVDGVSQGTISSGMGLATNSAPLTIGASSLDFAQSGNVGACNFFHQGNIDEVRFSNSVRYTTNFTTPSTAFTSDANTVALYHLDGCVSGLVPDASSNANNATPKNLTGACAFTLPSPPTIPSNTVAGNVQKAEYYYDTDPGFGNGTNIAVTAAANITLSSIPVTLAGLSDGPHHLFVRTKNSAGNWGITNNLPFYIVPIVTTIPTGVAATSVTKAEYFYDTDPGFGNGVDIGTSGTVVVDVSQLTAGVHYIYIRTKDAAGHWGITNVKSFYKLNTPATIPANPSASTIVKAEYYLDSDPGFGSGHDIAVTAGNDITLSNVFVDITGLANGVHHVFIRTKDANGRWGITNNSVFSIIAASFVMPANPVGGPVTKVEYFFDVDPGFGNGHIATIPTPATNVSNFNIVADISNLNDSMHTLYVRAFDDWGITSTKTFTKGSALPLTWLSFNATAGTGNVVLNWKTVNEINGNYFDVERSADGRTFTKIGTVKAANTTNVQDYPFTDISPLNGISYYRIKQVDKDGRYTYSATIAIRFGKNNPPIMVYPNPAREVVNILFDKPQQKNSSIELISNAGQVIQILSVDGLQSKQINVTALASGTYQLRITTSAGVSTQKIIIQH